MFCVIFCVMLSGVLRHLRGSKLKFLQTNHVTLFRLSHFIPLIIEERLKGEDKLQVGGWCHIVVSS